MKQYIKSPLRTYQKGLKCEEKNKPTKIRAAFQHLAVGVVGFKPKAKLLLIRMKQEVLRLDAGTEMRTGVAGSPAC